MYVSKTETTHAGMASSLLFMLLWTVVLSFITFCLHTNCVSKSQNTKIDIAISELRPQFTRDMYELRPG
jgi:hypothetical protein